MESGGQQQLLLTFAHVDECLARQDVPCSSEQKLVTLWETTAVQSNLHVESSVLEVSVN